MGHEYIKESDTFSTTHNGAVPKPSAQDVTDGKYLKANGVWDTPAGGGGGAVTSVNGQTGAVTLDLSDLQGDTTHRTVTDTEKQTWNNKSDFSGSYNDLTNKPTIPSPYHTYSTSEQQIGTWVNGKTVYEKSFYGTLLDATLTPIFETTGRNGHLRIIDVKGSLYGPQYLNAIGIGGYFNENFYSMWYYALMDYFYLFYSDSFKNGYYFMTIQYFVEDSAK